MDTSDLISISDYAKMHGVTAATVRQKILRGHLPATKIGSYWVVDKNTPYTDDRKKK